MATSYSLRLRNDSSAAWTFYVYQVPPDSSAGNAHSLAWLASPFNIAPGTQITFGWNTDLGFLWDTIGDVTPGVTFNASENVPANLMESNTITFTCGDNTPRFGTPHQGNQPGSLVITSDQTVPFQRFSVGISMSGAPVFTVTTGPNLTQVFRPSQTPTYWIAAGRDVSAGTVLDTNAVEQSLEVKFPPNVYELSLSLGLDNVWRQL